MNDLRTAAQQALEALLKSHTCPLLPDDCEEAIAALRAALAQQAEPQDAELSAALGWPGGISNPVLDRKVLLQKVAALMQDKLWEDHRVRHLWDHTLAQQTDPVAPVGRVVSANCEYATVHWLKQTSDVGGGDPKNSRSWPIAGDAVYTAPPQPSAPVYYEVSSAVTHNLWMRVSKSQYDEYIRSGWAGRTLHALTQQNITDSNKDN